MTGRAQRKSANAAWAPLLTAVFLLVGQAHAADPTPTPTPLSPPEQAAILQNLAPSFVAVEYTLQYDKGEAPYGSGWASRCPNCGQYHAEDTDQIVQDERPLEVAGLLIAPNQVITADVTLNPRFIKSIAVRFGKNVVDAKPAAFAKEQNAAILELAQPLPDAKPLAFDPARKPPYLAVTRQLLNGDWATNIAAVSMAISTTDAGRRFIAVPSYSLIIDRSGTPVGLSMRDKITADDAWKGSPAAWPLYTTKEIDGILAAVEKQAAAALLRVDLSYRSPRAAAARERYNYGGDEDRSAPRNVPGLLLDDRRIMVLANLKPAITARLERIIVQPPQGAPVTAKFSHTLTDYGCFIATLDKPLPGPMPFSSADIRDSADKLLFSAEVRIQGEKRVAYFGHRRIAGFAIGFRRQVQPQIPAAAAFIPLLLNEKGDILAIPLARREKVSLDQRDSYRSDSQSLFAAAYLGQILRDLSANADPANVPLSEQDENRLAWMGIELQGLTPELARANNVSDLTTDGRSGALVTYVHPDSPAAKAGIQAGFVLLRLHAQGQPKPLDVRIEDRYDTENFPWERMDEVSEQYFDQIPKPWPSVDNAFNRALTQLGFGKPYAAEFFHDGKPARFEFTVVAGPPHFDSAPRFKADAMGLTLRDLTYEVRRYFQRKDDEPGVIISKIEQGSKASTSGLKPYEIITHVNDQPVRTVKEFQKLTDNQTELRLSVKRMAKGRQVKIILPPPKTTAPATAPATPG